MLLIVGGESDPNTQRIVDQAHIGNRDYLFWDTDQANCLNIAWDFLSPKIDLGAKTIVPTSVFMRWNVFGGQAVANVAAYQMIQGYVSAWPDLRTLNRRSLQDTNNKSFNLRLASQVGLAIPKTLVLSNLSVLKTMPSAEESIAKPLAGGDYARVVSKMIEDESLMLNAGPQFVQDRLRGENLRVFSVGQQLFCFHLKTDKVDYRVDPTADVQQVSVPAGLIDPIRELVRQKGFDYCALDFRCQEGMENPVFLEVNSFPMFIRFDDAGKQCISNAILDFLCDSVVR